MFNTGANCNVKGPPTDPNACVIYHPIAHTAIYDTKTNTWTAGPDLPHPTGAEEGGGDTFANLLTNGNVLFQTNSSPGLHDPLARANARYASIRNGTMHLMSAEGEAPQQSCPPFAQYKFYEFDGTNLIPEPAATIVRAAQHPALADRPSDAGHQPIGRLHLLGHVSERVEADDHEVHLLEHRCRRELPDLGHAVQWPRAAKRVRG